MSQKLKFSLATLKREIDALPEYPADPVAGAAAAVLGNEDPGVAANAAEKGHEQKSCDPGRELLALVASLRARVRLDLELKRGTSLFWLNPIFLI